MCRVEKLGAPKNVDPKAKGPVSDFTLDVNELKTLAVENFEGKESIKDIQLSCVQLVSNMVQLADCSEERVTIFCPNARTV